MNPIIALAQYPISFHTSLKAWSSHVEKWVKRAAKQSASLLVFPEYASMELVSLFPVEIRTDIHEQVHHLFEIEADFCQVFAQQAKKYHVTIVAPSFPVKSGDLIHNRAYVFSPKGLVGYQDKFFMTRFEAEEWGVHSPIKTLTVFEADWGAFGIQTCYDIEFPLGTDLLCRAGAKLVVVPSCTETIRGATRVHVGARARALEYQCYTAVSSILGNAEWSPTVDINYGFGAVYATPDRGLPPEGIVAYTKPQKTGWLVQSLDFQLIDSVRNDGQVFNFKDSQNLEMGLRAEEIKLRVCNISS
ncbi:MAG: carbon-nitrogen hydrolase family protein [Saprospiraceae bacterium]|nr:carbon-nitrogen hydrolase family protein [Saprospiraceae bacterium]